MRLVEVKCFLGRRRGLPRENSAQESAAFHAGNAAVLFPSDDAIPICDFDTSKLEHLILVDSTWRFYKTVLNHRDLKGLPRVKLSAPPKTRFWRPAKNGKEQHLSSIEALKIASEEICLQKSKESGTFEDLLFFFNLIHAKIKHEHYRNPENEKRALPLPFTEDYKVQHRAKRSRAARERNFWERPRDYKSLNNFFLKVYFHTDSPVSRQKR